MKKFGFSLKSLYFILTTLLVIVNIYCMYKQELKKVFNYKKLIKRQSIGYRYLDMLKYTDGIKHMGYYTDKDLENKEAVKEMAYAQFMLAPAVLDYDNLELEYVLFDCSTPLVAVEKMREIGHEMVFGGKHGVLLTRKK